MDSLPLSEIATGAASIFSTGIVMSKMFFGKVKELESSFSDSIRELQKSLVETNEKLTKSLNEIDKRLAINSTIIDQFMKGGCIHGRKPRD